MAATILFFFAENQLTNFKLCPHPNFLIFAPSPKRISVTHFASPGVSLGAPAGPCEISASILLTLSSVPLADGLCPEPRTRWES